MSMELRELGDRLHAKFPGVSEQLYALAETPGLPGHTDEFLPELTGRIFPHPDTRVKPPIVHKEISGPTRKYPGSTLMWIAELVAEVGGERLGDEVRVVDLPNLRSSLQGDSNYAQYVSYGEKMREVRGRLDSHQWTAVSAAHTRARVSDRGNFKTLGEIRACTSDVLEIRLSKITARFFTTAYITK